MEWLLPVLMVLTLLGLIFSGYPVAFCLGGTAVVFAVIGISTGEFSLMRMNTSYVRIRGLMSNDVLLAIPFFIFMGAMLERSKLAENLLKTVGQLFGPMPGGMALAVVFVGALLAAATGVVGASVVAMGTISLPVMLRYKYQPHFATGIIAASGTLGQIIPPSLVLIVLADQIGVSITDLFAGALLPGFMLAAALMLYALCASLLKRDIAPPLPAEAREISTGQLLFRVMTSLVPPVLLILLVLGSIFMGIAPPTAAGALGGLGAVLLALVSGRLSWVTMRDSLQTTAKLTTMVMFLLLGASTFSLVFGFLDGDDLIKEMLANLPGGLIGALIIANLTIFLLGFFIDFFEIAVIVIPLLIPGFETLYADNPEAFHSLLSISPGALEAGLGYKLFLVWFGVMVAMNLQTSFLTPPFGFALFYLKGVCPPEIRTTQIYRGVIPFIIIQVLAITALVFFPELVTWMVEKAAARGP